MNSKINSDIENVINESSKKDRIYLGLFIPVIIICLIIQSVSLVSGIILRQDPFLIIVFILISLVFLFSLTCLIHYFLIPQQQVKILISTKIVEFCRVFEKTSRKYNFKDIKNIEIPKNIFSTIISFSRVKIELNDGSKISLFYIKSPEAFKKGFDLLNTLFSIDEENKNV